MIFCLQGGTSSGRDRCISNNQNRLCSVSSLWCKSILEELRRGVEYSLGVPEGSWGGGRGKELINKTLGTNKVQPGEGSRGHLAERAARVKVWSCRNSTVEVGNSR